MQKIIEVRNLHKKYGNLQAVNGISFDVYKGEVFGLLGENGAGKTTTLEMIEGLRRITSGKISVLGKDIEHHMNEIKQKIGVQLQSSAYYYYLTLKEILDLFASFYDCSSDSAKLLKMVGLESKANVNINSLSGGQKQRFSIIAALVNDPDIVFLDEPTTGLDPLARRHLWEIIVDIKKQGKTIILTTHYMEEAEMLCDRIAIMDAGKIIAYDQTHKIIEMAANPFKINFISAKLDASELQRLKTLGEIISVGGKKHTYEVRIKTQKKLNEALGILHEKEPDGLTVGRASLEDLFLELTGRTILEEDNV